MTPTCRPSLPKMPTPTTTTTTTTIYTHTHLSSLLAEDAHPHVGLQDHGHVVGPVAYGQGGGSGGDGAVVLGECY
jgi:hypothetical protein